MGQASGISNMARYIGGSVVVAAVATIFNSVTIDQTAAGASASEALAAGLSRSALLMAICAGLGIAIALLMARHQQARPTAIDRAAAAAAASLAHDPHPADASTLATGRSAQGRWAAGALGRHRRPAPPGALQRSRICRERPWWERR